MALSNRVGLASALLLLAAVPYGMATMCNLTMAYSSTSSLFDGVTRSVYTALDAIVGIKMLVSCTQTAATSRRSAESVVRMTKQCGISFEVTPRSRNEWLRHHIGIRKDL